MSKPPSRWLELVNGDVVVPFVCHRCGHCCRNYYPKIDLDMLPEIERILQMPIKAIQARLHLDGESHAFGRPTDCFFLDTRCKTCLIHAVKPDPCLSFPALTAGGTGQVDCPGHQEHKNVLNALARSMESFRVRNPTSARRLRPIPVRVWNTILKIIEETDVSDDYLQSFFEANGKPDVLLSSPHAQTGLRHRTA